MLNFIYYPVSWIMWVWHWLFEKVLPDTPGGSGVVWALSVVFLVFTLRAILYKPFVKQIQTTKKMQEINPQMQAVRKKYANDRVKMTEEMQKLQKEHGFNPLLGCLPMLMQIPVFIGLFHVLRSFNRMGTSLGQEGLSAEQTRSIGNYAFNADQVQNFLDARLFGIPLSSFITQPETEFQAFVEPGAAIDFTRWQIAAVVVPLMIIASFATHMNSRASVSRQSAEAEANPQTRIMNKLALWVFPLGILVTGPFFPAAILLYWVSNNGWTYVQQHIVFGRIAKEEEAAKKAKEEKLKAAAPRPGEKPLPGNFDPKKTMDRAYLALSEGRKHDAAGEFRKVVRYGQRKDDWIYRGANGIARAAFELALLTDEVDVRAALAEGSIDAARKDATKDGAGLAALERYLSLRFWQMQGWVTSGDNSRVVGVFAEDGAILDAYEEAWGDADRPAELAPYRRASLYRLTAVGHFQAGQSEDARNYAGKAAAILTKLDVDPGIAQELAQVKLIAAAPQSGRGKRGGSAQQRTADGQEALALLTDAANEPGAAARAKRRAEQAEAWVQSVEALGGKGGSKAQLAPIQSAGKELVADLLDAPDAVNTIIAEREITAPAAAQPKSADAQGGGGQRPRGQQSKSKKKRKGGRI